MEYRDPDGYFKDDVYSVLGRPGSLASSMTTSGSSTMLPSELPPPRYGSLAGSNFTDNETQTNVYRGDGENSHGSNTTSTGITVSSSGSEMTEKRLKVFDDDEDAEWEEAKRVLYTAFVGLLIPMAFRFVGRRMTFSLWTRFLTSYFKSS
ncbi:hypothetical protein IW140_000132 [Coemansia sp. RSA 1813]|nr:hypothetical protein EV178_000063 [Coemansia sp. RSA 1646]KAJ1772297.1 hypothetical protein LPJ74_001562 [Coemansia sp. RSA 1843]KAJ2093238.1 hypothetical protein IW138_000531 [Coemansia sp. RSA 986]KAJ2217498.1 hypothetical protein EV179_000332 [Coemansia sp. RSA 487]KAJ2573490.1 hypothetical protein IW140_000132 [Coemansia sp. RSA 1813]